MRDEDQTLQDKEETLRDEVKSKKEKMEKHITQTRLQPCDYREKKMGRGLGQDWNERE